jgi:hypothetical protein
VPNWLLKNKNRERIIFLQGQREVLLADALNGIKDKDFVRVEIAAINRRIGELAALGSCQGWEGMYDG